MGRVPCIRESYTYNPVTGIFEFTDGVKYTLAEAVELSKGCAGAETIRAVHRVKRIFDGVIEGFPSVTPQTEKTEKIEKKEVNAIQLSLFETKGLNKK